jgi:hypothetical protein
MIGARPAASGAFAVLVVGLLFCGRSGDPARADPAAVVAHRETLSGRAARAAAALLPLSDAVGAAFDASRQGSARTVAGDESPGERLLVAAALVEGAQPLAGPAAETLRAMAGSLPTAEATGVIATGHALDPDLTDASGLASIAGQLRETAPAADEFAGMRRLAGRILDEVDRALAALTAGDPDESMARLSAAAADHATLQGWEPGLVTLPIWLETTGAVIDALEELTRATESGDANAAREAADRFASAMAEAREADVALAIAMAEGGAAVASAPLQRLGDALETTNAALERVAALGAEVGLSLPRPEAPG